MSEILNSESQTPEQPLSSLELMNLAKGFQEKFPETMDILDIS